MKPSTSKLVLALCVASAILYNSWPLGYLLDPNTARVGLASDLEFVGHPYYWLFILGDVLTGICAVAAAWFMLRTARDEPPDSRSRSVIWAAAGLAVFGLFTAVCALLPLWHATKTFTVFKTGGGLLFGLDGLTNAIAELGILMALIAVLSKASPRKSAAKPAYVAAALVSILWSASGIWFVVQATGSGNAHLSQQLMLIITGLAIFVTGLCCALPVGHKEQRQSQKL